MAEAVLDRSVELCRSGGISLRLVLEALERPLRPDRTDAPSATLLSPAESPLERRAEFRGLSVLPLEPGILDRRERKDLDESLVSDLLKEGYDWSEASPEGAAPEPLDEEPPPSLEA